MKLPSVSALLVRALVAIAMAGSLHGQTWTLNGPADRFHSSGVYDTATDQLVLFGGQQLSGVPLNDVWPLPGSSLRDKRPPDSVSLGPGIPDRNRANGAIRTRSRVRQRKQSHDRLRRRHEHGEVPERRVVSRQRELRRRRSFVGGIETIWNATACPDESQRCIRCGNQHADHFRRDKLRFGVSVGCVGAQQCEWRKWGTPAWTQLSPSGIAPTARENSGSIYDSANNVLTIYAGDAGAAGLSDVWTLSHANGQGGTPAWSHVTPSGSAPAARTGHTAVYDSANNRMMIFGGVNAINATQFFGGQLDPHQREWHRRHPELDFRKSRRHGSPTSIPRRFLQSRGQRPRRIRW